MANRDILSLLEAGNKAQLEKLRENDDKNGFDNLGIIYIFNRIIDEVGELDEEMCKNKIDHGLTRRELADIANFCHMGILECDKYID